MWSVLLGSSRLTIPVRDSLRSFNVSSLPVKHFPLSFWVELRSCLSVAVVKCQKEFSSFIPRSQMYDDERYHPNYLIPLKSSSQKMHVKVINHFPTLLKSCCRLFNPRLKVHVQYELCGLLLDSFYLATSFGRFHCCHLRDSLICPFNIFPEDNVILSGSH